MDIQRWMSSKLKEFDLKEFSVLLTICGGIMLFGFSCNSYEYAYSQTEPGNIIIKELPALKALKTTTADGEYFKNANGMFRKLFRYIGDHDVSMTVPVETRLEPAGMIFFVGQKDFDKDLKSTDSVEVIELPARTVASVGYRGGYSEKNFNEARKLLRNWLESNPGYKATGEEFAVFWNGPFVPGFMKVFEVNIPVEKAE